MGGSMSAYSLQSGKNTPDINFDITGNRCVIQGKSYPENSRKFYAPLAEWIGQQRFSDNTVVELQFDYLSSSSVIAVLDILKRLERQNPKIQVKWIYESGDDDMKNVGLNFQKLCSLTFDFVETE